MVDGNVETASGEWVLRQQGTEMYKPRYIIVVGCGETAVKE
jgi:hypothetical protein